MIRVDAWGMRTTMTTWKAEQIRDVDRIAGLWRNLGHSSRSVRVYRQWTLQLLTKRRISDYRQLSAEHAVRLAYCFPDSAIMEVQSKHADDGWRRSEPSPGDRADR